MDYFLAFYLLINVSDKEKSGGLKLILKVGSGSCLPPTDEVISNGNHDAGDYLSKSHKKKKKKHKHHKEKRKRTRDDVTMHEEISLGEETLAEAPIPKRSIGLDNTTKVTTNLNESQNGRILLKTLNIYMYYFYFLSRRMGRN